MHRPDAGIGPAAAPSGGTVTESHRIRRQLGAAFWLAAVLVPVALTTLVGFTRGPVVEETLAQTGQAALRDHGIKGVRLVLDGRRMAAEVPTGRDPETVAHVLASVPGIAHVTTEAVYASAAEARACRTLPRALDRATSGQQVPFAGTSTTLTSAGRRMVDEVARLLGACRPAVVTIGGHTDGSTVNGSIISLQRARVVVGILERAGISSERLLARGYADQLPVDESDGPAADARNERVSVVVAGQ